MKLVHVIPHLGPGGPTLSLTAFIEWSARHTPDVSHRIVTLEPRAYPPLLRRLNRCGAVVLQKLNTKQIDEVLTRADVVLLKFWNTPLFWRFVARAKPPMRSVIWTQVRGDSPPQRLNAELLRSATRVALTTTAPACLLPEFAEVPVVPALVQRDRLAGLVRRAHDGFHVDYIGTTNSGKLDANIFPIMAALAIPDVQVRIYGGELEPALAQAHAAMPDPSRVKIAGFTEDIAEVFATTDVFAFPTTKTSYGSSELALQEAMLAGLPVVIYADRGPSHFVVHEKTGLVVSTPAEFTAAIERLYHDPDLRQRLGAAAKTYAEAEFGTDKHPARLAEIIEAASGAAKQPLFDSLAPPAGGNELTAGRLFLVSQGWPGTEAADAVAAWTSGRDGRLNDFAAAWEDICYKIEGGIIHWRNHAPDDPLLRAWSGHWLRRSGRPAEADAEFEAAVQLGADSATVARLAER